MVQITRLAVGLLVKDIFESAEYYRDVLGFSFDRIDGNPPGFCIVDRGGARLMLRQPRDPAAVRASNTTLIPDFTDAFLYTDDVEALAEEFRGKGADIVMEPAYRPIWDGKEMRVRDPNGWVLCFGQLMGEDEPA
jgi:catechol 2,3-dioxygenase-like lactoylglutathione lyase family enzyme